MIVEFNFKSNVSFIFVINVFWKVLTANQVQGTGKGESSDEDDDNIDGR